MDEMIRILMLEDDETDAGLIQRELTRLGMVVAKRVETQETFLQELKDFSPTVILADYELSTYDGVSALRLCQKVDSSIPFVFVTGVLGEERVVECMKEGAFDYVLKGQLTRLEPVIKKALEKKKIRGLVEEFKKTIQSNYQELEGSYEKLKEQDELKSDAVVMVAHELRTPLTIIKSAMESLKEGFIKPEDQKHLYDIILKATNRLARIIEDHLDLARIEKDKIECHVESLPLDNISQKVVDVFKQEAGDKNILLENRINQNSLILADEVWLERVFNNLIHNALKFTPSGGKITLSAAYTEKFMEISVEDTGCGIAQENLPELFQKYKQVKITGQDQKEGTGLGLAICKALVTAQGGNIWIASNIGQGTKVTFQLPIVQGNRRKMAA